MPSHLEQIAANITALSFEAPPKAPDAVIPPTPVEIDEMIEDYETAKRLHAAAKELLDEHKAVAVFYADHWGAVPAKAEQSKRLEGKLHTLTVTRGTTIAVAEPAVLDLQLELSKAGLPELFRKLFTASTKHKMVEGANETLRTVGLPQRLHQKVLAMFGQCIKVETNSPSVKVELREAEKRAKKAAR